MERHIERLTYVEVKKLIEEGKDTVVLPIGTIEAHGPHLPLATDVLIPVSLAERIADTLDALIAPPISYGITRSLLAYSGSLTVSSQVFKEYVKGILESLARHGFKKVIVVNGHGGHLNELKEVGMEIWSGFRLKTVMFHWWLALGEFTKEFFGEQSGHAAIDETAMIMAIDENLVKEELYSEQAVATNMQGVDVYPFHGSVILYKKGEGFPVFDASKATEYYEGVVKNTIELLKEILDKWNSI
ncbi:MAG: creatininase family protein [Candidatus Atabeyarchaeum deiterrae]|jgi:creatinine amidohydrolase